MRTTYLCIFTCILKGFKQHRQTTSCRSPQQTIALAVRQPGDRDEKSSLSPWQTDQRRCGLPGNDPWHCRVDPAWLQSPCHAAWSGQPCRHMQKPVTQPVCYNRQNASLCSTVCPCHRMQPERAHVHMPLLYELPSMRQQNHHRAQHARYPPESSVGLVDKAGDLRLISRYRLPGS